MKRRRLTSSVLAASRRLLIFAIAIICLASLLSVHVFPSARVPTFPDAFKLLKKPENGFRSWSGELRWIQELSPPQRSKSPPQTMMIKEAGDLNGVPDYNKLWKAPSSRDFVKCVSPSPSFSLPGMSRGYLVVHTNGGLNQMRAGGVRNRVFKLGQIHGDQFCLSPKD